MKNYQFYHIYPLGMLNQLGENQGPKQTLSYIKHFMKHYKDMNINGVYIGPLFESKYHGYETIDYYKVDQRLGSNEEFKNLVEVFHQSEIDVIVDCVFNHVSRDFFAFKDCILHKGQSQYIDWFYIDDSKNNTYNDGFSYNSWDGHEELVKLNLKNHQVKAHLFGAVDVWIDYFSIDCLRLDAADVMDPGFIKELHQHCKEKKADFFMMGEMVHGDYQKFLVETEIESVTNYECYKGMYSSLNDKNYFEIAYSFKRLFGENGRMKNRLSYNFVDNHDVNRISSVLSDSRSLYPLYIMLYTMKGYTSLYYKSEIGAKGMRTAHSDSQLRPVFDLEELNKEKANPLLGVIKELSTIRNEKQILSYGNYEEIILDHTLMVYRRFDDHQSVLIFINSDDIIRHITPLQIGVLKNKYKLQGYDILNKEEVNGVDTMKIYPNWGRIIL